MTLAHILWMKIAAADAACWYCCMPCCCHPPTLPPPLPAHLTPPLPSPLFQVFTIEPMVNMGTYRDVMWPDGWTAATADGKRSAQFEHQMVVTKTGADVLTARLPTSPPLWWEKEGE